MAALLDIFCQELHVFHPPQLMYLECVPSYILGMEEKLKRHLGKHLALSIKTLIQSFYHLGKVNQNKVKNGKMDLYLQIKSSFIEIAGC